MGASALILAAGEGTRMRSRLPKVAHEILGVPLVRYVVEAARGGGCDPVVVVTGHGAEVVEPLLEDVTTVRQERQLGTGHAVQCAEAAFAGADGSLVVLSGDSPLITADTVRALVAARESSGAAAAVLTAVLEDPAGYGRIVRDESGGLSRIVEEKDASDEERAIREVNTGFYCFDARVLFEHVHKLDNANAQGEFYLTDVLELLRREDLPVVAMAAADPLETLGINTRVQLAEAAKVMQRRINRAHMLAGVTMTDPDLVWIGPRVTLARDVTLEPMTFLLGETTVSEGCAIGPDTRIVDSVVGPDAVVDSSIVTGSCVCEGARIGPRAYLRPGTVVRPGAKVGTSVEIKNSIVGERSKVPHLSYIGDAEIGVGVNVGAGTITCNYDGRSKHRTVIEDGAFIGSDTMLVAPVRIGAGAVTGAGSAITRDVPADALAVERSEQRVIDGWAKRRREQSDDE
ncbi:bifunctional UDP-N-acetylglucosamine diphosphorylase/glucosamine-1-phosphate N-acetyltransferase GlmU [Coriobacteriia bacterium Es71-Z0120]|uniref:bifunctional UDP-N-acetylglucosamine diphosphorylase/glucosamine-1-phosphate N-acetyltransferase GlmU n=1 Tax=Parvivirga hydrogeniphila TaxID=2939460 RepID=UPI002260D680|nr:bifunctional UDP-N-acetylglucosamine diphosphorylase/glucosamine-1-phosphate N-acetyltransferase GlmU [Parvivirga hydrogeniphila]MCL4079503.1 bifunctional UDP-N-acetylglucosamine diphosphorylase/glucosamine-1-phosphate N-acetyltransferase GlmU [Parvivirga hydrogeniphila]